MDPVTFTATLALAGKLAEVGANLWKQRSPQEPGLNAVTIASDGTQRAQGLSGSGARLLEPAMFSSGFDPVQVDIRFGPADDWAGAYLLPDQPVLVGLEDQDNESPLDSIVIPTLLGDGVDVALYPGQYFVGAYIFLDEDLDTLDGIGAADFTVDVHEPPFVLRVAVDAVPEPDMVLDALGLAGEDEQTKEQWRCEAVTQAGRRCRSAKAHDDPLLCGSHLARLQDGLPVVDYQTGDEFYLS